VTTSAVSSALISMAFLLVCRVKPARCCE
jgi:hypothetical protein